MGLKFRKRIPENHIFLSEIKSEFGEPSYATPPKLLSCHPQDSVDRANDAKFLRELVSKEIAVLRRWRVETNAGFINRVLFTVAKYGLCNV